MKTDIRCEIVDVSKRLVALGLNRGTSGNIGARYGNHFLVTPSGMPAENMSSMDIVEMDYSGEIVSNGKPSSEWRFHRDILQARPETGAIIHVHSTFATTMSCLRLDIPAFHYMIAVAGGNSIRCAPYALFGTQELSDLALVALEGRKACLLANHGMIVLGANLDSALALTVEVETLCEQYWRTLQVAPPYLLNDQEMLDVTEKFKGYGRWGKS